MQTIYEGFINSAEAHPGKVLFDCPGRATVSYGDARDLTNRLAGVLAEIGVRPGDRVAAQVDKSPEAICLYLATLQVGGVYLPLNSDYTVAEIDYFLSDAAPRVFVCTPSRRHDYEYRDEKTLRIESLGAVGDGSLMDRATAASIRRDPVARQMSDHAAILYTSGTTGRSKGAVLTHGNLASNTAALLESWRFTGDDRLIHALPIFHTHGLFVATNMSLVAGATMIWMSKFDSEQVIDHMAGATVLMGVPTFYTRLLKSPRLNRDSTASMRLFVSGSAPLLAEDHRNFEERTGHAILERYGMTETCMITTNPYDGARKPGAVGMPLPGIAIRVTDRESGAPLRDGEIGVIEVCGPNVFEGYWRMPEKTAAEFRKDRFFITGDLGQIGEDGYLRIVGRDKDLVISGGYNIYPKEIEGLIDLIPGVLESAIIGVQHPDLGEAVTAIIVLQADAILDEASVLSAICDKLARYKQPKKVLFVEELLRNVMGKVQKAELRQRYADIYK